MDTGFALAARVTRQKTNQRSHECWRPLRGLNRCYRPERPILAAGGEEPDRFSGIIRCIFPCYQGILAEKGSHLTVSSAIIFCGLSKRE